MLTVYYCKSRATATVYRYHKLVKCYQVIKYVYLTNESDGKQLQLAKDLVFTRFSFLPGGKAASGVSYYACDLVKSNSRTWALRSINKTKTEATTLLCDIIHQTK